MNSSSRPATAVRSSPAGVDRGRAIVGGRRFRADPFAPRGAGRRRLRGRSAPARSGVASPTSGRTRVLADACWFDPTWPSGSRYQGGARRIAHLFCGAAARRLSPDRPRRPCRQADDDLQLATCGRGHHGRRAHRAVRPALDEEQVDRRRRQVVARPGPSDGVRVERQRRRGERCGPAPAEAGSRRQLAVEVQPVLAERAVVQRDEQVDQAATWR